MNTRTIACTVLIAASAALTAACGGGGSSSGASASADSSSIAPAAAPITPTVFWASQPVNPNETVLASTAGTDSASTVQIASLANAGPGNPGDSAAAPTWQDAQVVQASGTAVKFVIPSRWSAGVYAYRIQSHGLTSAVYYLNAPDVTFLQGDAGDSATQGGWIQAHGSGIAMTGATPQMDLVANGAVVATLSADSSGNNYAQRFLVPSGVPVGSYSVYLHNGNGGPAAWTQYQAFIEAPITTFNVAAPNAWPSTVYNVTQMSGATTDAQVAAAIALATANGGGVIYFPAGTYTLVNQIVLPEDTVLSGAGASSTTIQWTSTPTVAGSAVQALIEGATLSDGSGNDAAFSIEDISIVGPASFAGYAVSSQSSSEFAWIRNTDVTLAYISAYNAAATPTALFLRNRHNFEVTNSVLDACVDLFARENVGSLRVESTTLNWRDENIYLSGRSHGFIVASNVFNLRGDATTNGWAVANNPDPGFEFTSFFDSSTGGPYTRDLYYANNSSTRDETTLPPSYVGFTYDGGQGIYLGHVASTSGTTVTLAGQTLVPSDGSTYNWAGAVAQILDGTGTGQWRYLTAAGPGQNTVTVDRPWDVAPDSTSIISLLNLQGRVLMIGNDFAQEQTVQDYYFAMDVLKAQNTFGVTGALMHNMAWIGAHYQGLSPGWHYQLLDNSVTRGTGVYLTSEVTAKMAGYSGTVGAYHVYRGNVASASVPTMISFTSQDGEFSDIVAEHNVVTDLNLGPTASDALNFAGVVLRGNTAVLDGNLAGLSASADSAIAELP